MNDIERFMPTADIRECHDTIVHAPANLVFDVAEHFDIESVLPVRAIFWLRTKFFGLPYVRMRKSLVETCSQIGWGRLSYTPEREIVMGAVTQPWAGDVKFRAVPPEKFEAFNEPDLVKIVWTLEAHSLAAGRTRFRSQTRVLATDEGARRKFKAYWRKFGIGIVLIRLFVGPTIKREAERRFRAQFVNRAAPPRGHASRTPTPA